jgi:hypothetical protein
MNFFVRSRIFSLSTILVLSAGLLAGVSGCKSKQDAAIEQARQKAAATNQPQQVVSTDKNGSTITTTVQPPVPGEKAQAVTTTVTPAPGTAPSTATPDAQTQTAAAPAPAAPAPPPVVHVTAGTTLVIRIDQRISAKESYKGQKFTGEVVEPVNDPNGQAIIPKGSPVRGVVDLAKGRGNFKGAADIKLRLTSLTLNGKSYPLETHDVLRSKKGKGKRTGALIGGGSGLGLLIGGLAGGGKGALIGGLAGAGAGTAGAGLTGNRDLVIPAETVVRFKLADDLEFPL